MQPSTATATADSWAATNLLSNTHTRIIGSEERSDLANQRLGAQVGVGAHEMFAICPPGEALQLAFERIQPTFIAVHDVGINRSASLLAELAGALRQPLQTLSIRQQGTGLTLAQLQFIELPGQRGTPLRLYSTAVEGDTSTRVHVAQTLLAFSRLGVLLVGALPEHALATQFNPLRDRLLTVPWNNRNLLLVPQGPTTGLVGQALRLVDGTVVQANAAPAATQTGPIWKSIHEAWSRLRNAAAEVQRTGPTPSVLGAGMRLNLPNAPAPAPASAPTPAAPQRTAAPAMPRATAWAGLPAAAEANTAPPAAAGATSGTRLDAYAQACGSLRGASTCAVFELETGRLLAQAGPTSVSVHLITQATALLKAMSRLESDLRDTEKQGDVLVTLDRHVVLVRRLARLTTTGMALVLDKDKANPMLMRAHLQRLEPLLDA